MSLTQYVGTLGLLGDESRLRLCILLQERELSVSELVRVTGLSQSRVSTHLARLREGGLVRDRREGQHAFYALAEGALSGAAKAMLDEAKGTGDATLEGDRLRLCELVATPGGSSFVDDVFRQYSPGRTWQSLAVGFAALAQLGDVLDVGSGDGAVASYLAPSCRALTCIDSAPRMVEATRARLAAHANVRVLEGDVHALPFPPASFDVVLLFHTLAYAEHPQRAIEQCARVLRPGGRLVLLSLEEHAHHELTSAYGELHHGFSPKRLRGWLTRAKLHVSFCDVACREAKKPHFQIVLATAERVAPTASENTS